jgi:hypothetical protein
LLLLIKKWLASEAKATVVQIWPSVNPEVWRAALISAVSLLRPRSAFAPRILTLSPVCWVLEVSTSLPTLQHRSLM